MAKQLNVSMNFTANTSQAKSQIQDLSNMLNKIAYGTDLKVNASGISEASTAAKELSYHLKNAYNVKTGNFDLSALNKSLKGANTDITQLSNKLLTAGKTGQEAFVKLSQTIAQADQPVITMGTHLNNLFNTLKNTLRWQISNSMITGVTGAIQQAFYYAQDLDKSLNNIRIVTSKSSDEMAKFAKEANAAARSLSTTTTKYTDASLIYYQQGLSDEEVKARTDATVKMANVTGDSAEVVSSQMTAIWNNFAKGSENLEYYADVITALGAATASSSAEIAEGLEKFASVGETVGLSYEYATSALATVVAETRQSADVVGTSFKTLFSRIQGLQLGETQEDGTTLNKYSEALAKVGINIKDDNGELKKMDAILDEMGEKWQRLDEDTQVALAETVGGARQYVQLISLMKNWETFKENLVTARGSEGTLEEQAEIYADSWQAAKDRVRASAEGIYDSLINEDFFKDLDNWLAKMLDGIGDFIDGIGGIKGVLLTVGAIATSLLSKQVGPAVEKLKQNFSVLTGGAQKAYTKINEDTKSMVSSQLATGNYSEEQKLELEGNARILSMKAKLAQAADTLSEKERSQAEFAIQSMEMQNKEAFELLENKKKAEKVVEDQTKKFEEQREAVRQLRKEKKEAQAEFANFSVSTPNKKSTFEERLGAAQTQNQAFISSKGGKIGETIGSASSEDVTKMINQYVRLNTEEENCVKTLNLYSNERAKLAEIVNATGNQVPDFEQTKQTLLELTEQIPFTTAQLKDFDEAAISSAKSQQDLDQIIVKMINAMAELSNGATTSEEKIKLLAQALSKKGIDVGPLTKEFQKLKANLDKATEALEKARQAGDKDKKELIKLEAEVEKAEKAIKDFSGSMNQAAESSEYFEHHASGLESIMKTMGGLGSIAMGLNSLSGSLESLKDPDASGWEKFSSVIMGLSFGLPMVTSGIKNATIGIKEAESVFTGVAGASKILQAASSDNIKALRQEGRAVTALSAQQKLNISAKQAEIVASKMAAGATLEQATATAVLEATIAPLAVTLLIIAGVLTVLTVGIVAIYKHIHKADIEAKQAAESYKELSEAFDQVKTSVDEVNSTLDGLEDRYKSIEDMTYGTTEWGKSVRELNKELEEMIDKYNLVEGEDWYRDAEGIIRLTDPEAIKDLANQSMIAAERVKNSAGLRAKSTQLNADRVSLDRSTSNFVIKDTNSRVDSFEEWWSKQDQSLFFDKDDVVTRQQYEADIQSQKAAQQNASDIVVKDIADKLVEYMAQNPGKSIEDAMEQLGLSQNIQDEINSNIELKNSIDNLAEDTRELSDAYKNEIIDELLGSKNLENIDDDYRTGVLEQIGEGSKNQVEAMEEKILASGTKDDIFAKYGEKFAKDSGYKYKDGKFYGVDENGIANENEAKLVDEKDIAHWAALQEVVESCDKSIQNYVETVEESKKVWDSVDSIKDAWEEVKEGTNDADAAMGQFAKQNSKAFATILGTSQEAFEAMGDDAATFASKNAPLIEEALKGDEEAVEELRNRFAEFALENQIKLKVQAEGGDFDTLWSSLQDNIADVENTIDAIEVGAQVELDDTNFYNQLNEMMTAAEFTSESMANAFLDSMGIDAELEETQINSPTSTTVTYPIFKYDKWGIPIYQTEGKAEINETDTKTIYTVKAGTAKKSVGGDVVRRASGGGKTSAPSTSSPSSSGSSGGGSKETKDKDETEVERYYVINQVLKELTSQMNKLGKEKDRAFGANKLKAINNEITLLQQQKKAQQEYLREAKMYRDTDQAGLKNLFGGQFNAQGIFTNYDDVFAKEQKAYNDAVAKYNKSSQSDSDKNRLAEAEARWNKFSDLAKQYESDLQDVQKAEEDIQDTINEIADKSLEIIQYTVQLKLDMAEDTKKYLDFLLSGAERKEFNVAEQIAITGKTAQVYSDQRAAAAQGLADILGAHGLTTEQAASLTADQLSAMNFTEDEVDTIREYRDTVIEADEALADLADTINEYVTKALDEWMDKLDKTASNYEHLNKLLNNYKNILGLIDQKATGIDRKLIEDLNQAMLDNARNKYESSVESYNALKQLEKQYQAELNDATASGDAQRIAYWTKNMEDLQERIKDANETMLENWQETLEIAQKNFQETVKATLDSMYDGIGGLANFDLLKQQFEYEKDLADDYIDDFNKAYELNKLNRKIQNSLDDTKGIKNKELLRDLQKEINDLQASGAQISKYDLEYLQKKYEMRKAEIALEEAQNAKTTVRMRQDNEGNWGYVYTADQDNVNNAKQNYEDKLADLYNLTKEYSESTQDQYMKILDEYNKSVEDAATRYANDSEAFAQAMAQIQEFYGQKLAYLSGELGKTFSNNHDLYVHDTQYYQEMTDSNIFNSAMFAQRFDETVLGTLRGMPDTLEELNTNVESSWDRASETVTAAYNTLYDYLYGEQGIAPSIATVTQEATQEIAQASSITRQNINRDTKAMTSDMTNVINKVVEWQKKWTTNIAAMNTSDAKLIKELGEILTKLTNIGNSKPTPQVEVKYKGVDQLDSLLKKLGQLHDQTVTITTHYVTTSSGSGGSGGGGSSSSTSNLDKLAKEAGSVSFKQYQQYSSKTRVGNGAAPYSKTINNKKYVSWDNSIWFLQSDLSGDGTTNAAYIAKGRSSYKYYDTGGYTGEWDSSGKLAVLHQKEIVLNKDDTANFLAGISVLRDIVKQIDLRSLAERDALSNIQVNVPRDSQNAMQQNVVINADFPGVQTHSEIEMAFENLLGKATQFANRKK